ncbi:MAG TPA: T9SS type A sorting domain-containing protein [bacterium]
MFNKKGVFILVLIPLLTSALSFTLENIDVYKADKPAVCIDDSGWIYLVGNKTGNDIVKFIKKSTGAWLPDSLLFSVVPSTGYNCRSSAATGPNQTLHILYRVQGGTYGWPVYTNNSSGSFTACDTLMKNASQSTWHYGIAVDNLNHAHIVCEMYSGSYNLAYFYPFHADSMVWLVGNAVDPTIAVAQDNTVHIAYSSTTNTKIYYLNNAGGAFGTPILVSDTTGMDPSIAVDNAGKVHICWTKECWSTLSNLYYATNKTGTFETTKITSTSYCEGYSAIALDKDNDVGIVFWVYHANDTASIGFASKKAAAVVFTVDSVDMAFDNPSYGSINQNDRAVAFDSLEIAHFCYMGRSGTAAIIMYGKTMSPIGVEELKAVEPISAASLKCCPNPFNRSVAIKSEIRNPKSEISLNIYDVSGRLVRSFKQLHNNSITWDRKDAADMTVPCGVYIVQACLQLENGDRITMSEKLVVVE